MADTTRMDEAIDHAEGFIDSYVGRKYKIPIVIAGDSVLTAMMKSIALDLAVFFLVTRPGGEVPDNIQRAYDLQLAWLTDVSKGIAVLPSSAALDGTETRDPIAAFGTAGTGAASNRVFSRANQDAI